MRNTRSLFLSIAAGLAMALAAGAALAQAPVPGAPAKPAELTAAGLWQKIEKGKTVGMAR